MAKLVVNSTDGVCLPEKEGISNACSSLPLMFMAYVYLKKKVYPTMLANMAISLMAYVYLKKKVYPTSCVAE